MQDDVAGWKEVTHEECLAMRKNTEAFVKLSPLVNGPPLVGTHSMVMQQTWPFSSSSSADNVNEEHLDDRTAPTNTGIHRTAATEAEAGGEEGADFPKKRPKTQLIGAQQNAPAEADLIADAEAKFQDSKLAVFVHPRHNNQQTYSVESITNAIVHEYSLCHQWSFILSIDRGLKYAGVTLSLHPTDDDWVWASQMLGCDYDKMKALF
jgi:hypothetical protein